MRRKYLLYFLSITSAFLTASAISCDTYLSVTYIRDPWILGTTLFLTGILTAIPLMIGFCIKINKKFLGTLIDPQFRGFIFPKGDFLKNILIASSANALSSILYFIIVTNIPDPSAVLAFSSLTPAYLIITDIIIEKEHPSLVEVQSILIITLGVLLVSLSLGTIDLIQLAIVLGPYNLSIVLFNIATRELRRTRAKSTYYDSLNIRFWLIIFSTLIFIILELMTNPPSIVTKSISFLPIYFPLLALDMTLTFFAYAAYIRALAIGKTSIVNALASLSTIFGLGFSIAFSYMLPGIFRVKYPLFTWIIKIFGIFLALSGTIALSLTEVKALVFIKVRAGRPSNILELLFKIHGIEAVSAVAGRWDYILYIKLRTIKQAYYIITNELSKIPNIIDIIWVTILREYETV